MRCFLSVLLIWAVLAAPIPAHSTQPTPPDSSTYEFSEQSEMTVYGSSNVRDWTMDVKTVDGAVTVGQTEDGVPSIQKIRVEVQVKNMVSDKDRLQRHAHEALKKENHPTISFSATDIQVAKADADSFSVVANGKMTIAGETRSATVRAKGIESSDGQLTVKGDHKLKLTTYKVERPSLMFGTIKVDDPIRIAFDVVLNGDS